MKKNKLTLFLFLALAGIAIALYLNRSNGTLKVPLKDFAVQDNAAITKIFMADRKGKTVTLDKEANGDWIVNKKFKARPDAINTLLYTIKMVEVKSPVGKNLYNRTMSLMASNSVKIEIYSGSENLKTYYVGHPTMDNLGTFMYMEGSSQPFITYIPGFNGYLTSRFFTNEVDWRDRSLLRMDPRKITNVKIEDFARPERSLELFRESDSTYKVTLLKSGNVIKTEAARLREYLMAFKVINFQKVEMSLPKLSKDSIESTPPFGRLSVKEERSKDPFTMQLYRMPINELTRQPVDDETGKPNPYDLDRFYIRIPGDTTWYVGQYFHFDNFMRDPASLQPGGPKVRQFIPN